jgi:hypothetical protein
MTPIISLPITSWEQPCSESQQTAAMDALESGCVLLLPDLPFALLDGERQFLSAATAGAGKNVSLSPADGSVSGSSAQGTDLEALSVMMERFAAASRSLLRQLLPHYGPALRLARTSFRPVEIAGRASSWRKDDTRLHVDSFPSSPTGGKRILRLFTNVNPDGQNRVWRVGEPFEDVARRFMPALSAPAWGSRQMLSLLGITKGPRSAYDHHMLQLHDRMKADTAYQITASQQTCEFKPGSTWLVYTDQVSHAAMGGRCAFEQTFNLPVDGMRDPARSPLKVLERLLERELV